MNTSRLSYQTVSAQHSLWHLTLVTFPITSPPFFPLGGVVAKPLSIFFALLLFLVTITTRGNRSSRAFSIESLFLFLFTFIAGLTGLLHWEFYDLGNSEVGMANYLRSLPTLVMGAVFYLTFRMMNINEAELKSSELVIQWAMMFSVSIELLQAVADKILPFLLPVVVAIDSVAVDVAITWTDRYHGLAYEPSWLGEQLILICIPLSLSRILSGSSLGTFKVPVIGLQWRKEVFFFSMATIGIILSGSRSALIGLLLILLAASLLYLFKNRGRLFNLNSVLKGCLIVGAVLVGTIYLMSNDYLFETYLAIFSASSFDELALMAHFGTRASVWYTSFQVFLDNPILGVGLGGSEVYYSQYVPAWVLNIPEAQGWMSGEGRANPKNLITRLLSETGMVGFLIFFAFVILHFRGKGDLRHQYLKIALAIGFLVISFQSDTFSLPTWWFALCFLYLSGKYKGQLQVNHARELAQT